MNPSKRTPRRVRKLQLGPEPLESRELLTGGAGDTFAIIPGTVSTAGGTTSIKFTIDNQNFKAPHSNIALGIDVVPTQGSSVKPFISSVDNQVGALIPQTFHSVYNPHATHLEVAENGPSAVITPVRFTTGNPGKPTTYTVNVQGLAASSGGFLLGFYLPGDANGDGKVDKTDIAVTKAAMNTKTGDANYNFNADVNRDGRIGKIDLAYVLQNQGVSTNISPVVQANLVPASVTDPTNRTTTNPTAQFTGNASANATITYTNTSFPSMTPVTTTADGSGNYTITVPLGVGSNVYQVQSVDSFGQTISGNVNPVTYTPATT